MSTIVLPGKLVLRTRDQIPKCLQHYAFKILSAMWLKHIREGVSLLEYTPISRRYVDTVLGTKATVNRNAAGEKYPVGYRALKALENASIIEIDKRDGGQTYSPPIRSRAGNIIEKGTCRNLRIAPDLTFGQVEVIKGKLKERRRLSEVENAARMHLEEIRLPFDTPAELAAWIHDFVRTPAIQNRIEERITELKPKSERNYPLLAHLLLGDSAQVIERDNILAYLRPGYRLFSYRSKSGRVTNYIARPGDLEQWKTAQLESSFGYQLTILNEMRAVSGAVHRNDTNDRLDTPLTNLFSKFIALATVKGERLAGIDITNSQFTFFAGIISEALRLVETDAQNFALFHNKTFTNAPESYALSSIHLEKDKSLISSLKTSNYKLLTNLPNQHLTSLISYLCHIDNVTNWEPRIKLVQNRAKIRRDFSDLKKFVEVCQAGTLYEYIAARKYFKKELNELSDEQVRLIKTLGYRGKVKASLFALFFDRYHAHKRKPEKAADRAVINEVFPSVVRIVDRIKKSTVDELKRRKKADPRRYDHIYYKKGEVQKPDHVGNASFAVMLQRLESVVVIDGILRKSMRRYWAASKHDSILCTESNYPKVLKIVRSELDKVFGPGNYRLKKQSWSYDPETMNISQTDHPIN